MGHYCLLAGVCRRLSSVTLPAGGGRAGRRAIGQPTLHGRPVLLRLVRATPCFTITNFRRIVTAVVWHKDEYEYTTQQETSSAVHTGQKRYSVHRNKIAYVDKDYYTENFRNDSIPISFHLWKIIPIPIPVWRSCICVDFHCRWNPIRPTTIPVICSRDLVQIQRFHSEHNHFAYYTFKLVVCIQLIVSKQSQQFYFFTLNRLRSIQNILGHHTSHVFSFT